MNGTTSTVRRQETRTTASEQELAVRRWKCEQMRAARRALENGPRKEMGFTAINGRGEEVEAVVLADYDGPGPAPTYTNRQVMRAVRRAMAKGLRVVVTGSWSGSVSFRVPERDIIIDHYDEQGWGVWGSGKKN